MLISLVGFAIVTQLTAAEVSVHIHNDSATVEASYKFSTAVDTVEFTLIRLSNQDVVFSRTSKQYVDALPGLYKLSVQRSTTESEVVISYKVLANLHRIPIAIPTTPPPLDGALVRIRVIGLEPDRAFGDGFPRLTMLPDGSALAEMESLPGLLRVPPRSDQISVNSLADASVALLILFATVFWFSRRWMLRSRRRSAGGS